ncbi:MAG: tRNA lysidine(34) synthetase TilS [Acidobacteria bacterium]|nr:tRNA lysidine(34) synthetase TilS [Acidobacteriota bacterium]
MHPFVTKVSQTISHHRMLDSTDRVLIGVSGGADSVCLAVILQELGYQTAIAHVNHGLRGLASDEDEQFTKRLATKLSMPFFCRRPSISQTAGNVEEAGREARRAFFRELSSEHGFAKIALAHTRDDRVETFLMNLMRGSGVEGLVSMAPVSGATVRPLIERTRTEIEEYLKLHHQEWRTDATNVDRRFARNRLRHDVVPELAAKFNPNLVETLSRTVTILGDEDALLARLTENWLSENGTKTEGEVLLNARVLECEPVALVRRVLRAALREAGSTLKDVSFKHIERARGLLDPTKSGKWVEIPGGLVIAREFDKLAVRVPTPALTGYEYELQIPGSVHVPELGTVFRAEIIDPKGNEPAPGRVFVDGDSVGPCVRIRNWKPGDHYKPVGLPSGKLKKLFQRARIPRSRRATWPVFVAGSTIFWVASFPVSREFAPCGRSQKIVAIEALRA